MSSLDKSFEKAMAAAAKPAQEWEPQIKLLKAHGLSRSDFNTHCVEIRGGDTLVRTQWMSLPDAKDLVASVKKWIKRVRRITDDVEAVRTVQIVGDSKQKWVYLEWRDDDTGQSFPHEGISTSEPKKTKRLLQNMALKIRQGTASSPTMSHLPSWFFER